METKYGASGDKFGHQDYFQQLKGIWDANDPGADRQRKLAQKRQDVLSWMKQEGNVDRIGEANRQGQQGGLFEQISKGDLTHEFVGKSAGSKDWIGHADLMAGRAAGHSWEDFKGYLDQNPNLLRMGNVKGAGGLYDQVSSEARMEGQQGDWLSALSGLKENFGSAIEGQTEAFNTGMGGVSDAIKSQTESHEKYRADEMAWRRRAEQMQMQQMEEARRQSKAKPIVQVLPGASAFGGGGGGTGAFARKKKQTTGLNIS